MTRVEQYFFPFFPLSYCVRMCMYAFMTVYTTYGGWGCGIALCAAVPKVSHPKCLIECMLDAHAKVYVKYLVCRRPMQIGLWITGGAIFSNFLDVCRI